MRITSRLRSRRLCAFSVLSARMRKARLLVRRDERGDLAQPEHLRRGEPMAAVRRPEAALGAAHDDDRVEERAGLLDLLREPLGVGRREIALERRRLDRVARQAGEQQRVPAEGLAIGADRDAARLAHGLRERGELGAFAVERDLARRRTAGLAPRREPLLRAAAGRLLPRRHVRLLGLRGEKNSRSAFA